MLAGTARRGLFALALLMVAMVAALMATGRSTSAVGLRATWTITGRGDAAAFRPGAQLPASGRAGFEVISFAAAGPSVALDSYVYAGADAAPGSAGAARPFVTCDATASAGMLMLHVGDAFPHAGCVYFPKVTNTGDGPIEVDLGALAHPAGVFCGESTCKVDIVAGGRDATGVTSRCAVEGAVAHSGGGLALTYRLERGASVTCPVFVVLLPPAAEATTYSIIVEPPRPRTPAPGSIEAVAVAGATPQPPRTGFGLVVGPAETQPGDGSAILAVVSFLALLGAVAVLGLPGRHDEDRASLAQSQDGEG